MVQGAVEQIIKTGIGPFDRTIEDIIASWMYKRTSI
jgi:hypothetical protein